MANGHTLVASPVAEQVLEVDAAGTVVWSYGTGTSGCTDAELSFPSDLLEWGPDRLIVDQQHNRLLRVTLGGSVIWRYGDPTCASGSAPGQLAGPFAAEILPNGDVLLADVADHWVAQLHPTGGSGATVIWEYGIRGSPGSGPNQISSPDRAVMLANGNVLIADTDNARVIEVSPTPPFGGTVVWQYGVTGTIGDTAGLLQQPYDAERGPLGTTLIADQGNNRVIEVSPLVLALNAAVTSYPAGTCAGPIALQVTDVYATPQTPPVAVSPSIGASFVSAALYADPSCATAFVIPTLSSSQATNFYLRADGASSVQVSAAATGYVTGNLLLDFQGSTGPNNPLDALRLAVGCSCNTASGGMPGLTSLLWMAALVGRRRR
jgi:MYXO-CTERM domain-containing protein